MVHCLIYIGANLPPSLRAVVGVMYRIHIMSSRLMAHCPVYLPMQDRIYSRRLVFSHYSIYTTNSHYLSLSLW